MQNAPREHSAILLTFIKLPFVFKDLNFVLSLFEWPLKTGFAIFTFFRSTAVKPEICFYSEGNLKVKRL